MKGEKALQVIVFDLGGTLMEYKGMPHSWVEYYEDAFKAVNLEFKLDLTEKDIQKSCEILKSKNARVIYREIEYTPNDIFSAVTEHWNKKVDLDAIINSFYKGHELKPAIYDDTLVCLDYLKEKGIKIATLTDLPTAMPDEIFKQDIAELLEYFDLYVSSLTCGYRKPNKNGLMFISEHFNVNIQDLIFIGDEEKDVIAAKNAKCISILINRSAKELDQINYGQDFTITSLSELRELLNI